MFKTINRFVSSCFQNRHTNKIGHQTVRHAVSDTVQIYGQALHGLEQYDKGELPETEEMVNNTSLQRYLRRI